MAPVSPNPATSANRRPNPASSAAETFEIPMNRISPIWWVVVVLGVAAIVGGIMYARRPSAKAPSAEQAQTAAPATETKEQLAARRQHMEITQKSMARAAERTAGTESAAAEAAEQPAAPSGAAARAGASIPKRASAPAGLAAAASQPAPKSAGPKPVPRKQLDALDKMGDDLAGQLK
jgi:hypothetical protein